MGDNTSSPIFQEKMETLRTLSLILVQKLQLQTQNNEYSKPLTSAILPCKCRKYFTNYHIFSCISRFVYKSTPVFQAKNQYF